VPSSEQRSANEFEFVVRYEQRKICLLSTTIFDNWCHGLSVFIAAASNNRLELLADNIESAKFAERSHIFI
jgi:hypothetical protein